LKKVYFRRLHCLTTVKSFIVHATVQHLVKSHNVILHLLTAKKQIMTVKKLKVNATMLYFEKSIFQKVTLSYGKKQITTVKSFIVHATVQHLVESHLVRIFIILA